MKKVFLRYYSANNLGDDLMVKILADRYNNTIALHSFIKNETFKKIVNIDLHSNKFINTISILFQKINKSYNKYLLHLANKNDLLIYVGGSLFIEGNSIYRWQFERIFYSKLKIPYYIIGSNVGPYKSNEFIKILNVIFINAKDVCFRDSYSSSLFDSLNNIRQSTDLVFSLNKDNYKIKNNKIAVFSIMDIENKFSKNISKEYINFIIDLTKKYMYEGYEIKYVSFCKSEGDEFMIDNIISKIIPSLREKISIIRYRGNIKEIINIFAESEFIIGTRFHSVVLGILFDKKVLPLIYSQKTNQLLDDIKFKGTRIDIKHIKDVDIQNDNLDIFKTNQSKKLNALSQNQFKELDKILEKKNV